MKRLRILNTTASVFLATLDVFSEFLSQLPGTWKILWLEGKLGDRQTNKQTNNPQTHTKKTSFLLSFKTC